MELTTKDSNQTVSVSDDIFDYVYNEGLIHQAVVSFMNNARSATSVQKTRAEVRGGGKKPWNQKGTGRARAGSSRSPIWRAGGVTFASGRPNYKQKLNKKMYRRAIRSILSELNRQGGLIVLDDFQCETHKTKDFVEKMKALSISNAFIILNEVSENAYLAQRNLYDFDICDVHTMDPVSLLRYEKVLVTRAAIQHIEEQLQ